MMEVTRKRIGPYQVLEQVGRGGMAAVFRARDTQSDRIVALKLVAPQLSHDPKFRQRFRREAEVLRKLKHPHIMPVEDYGEQDGYAYLVMPFLRVGTLTDRLRAGPVRPREGERLIQQIARALDFAHAQGVIHRDVKPSNVLLDEDGNALLADFGLAQLQERGASLTGSMLVGTPAYMSPEQARGEKASPRSDQYSLGVILFELTTGQLPFEAETPIAVALKHINEPLPLARAASPNVPEAVEQVILKATAKDPLDRFDSVAEMSRTFRAALAHSLDPDSNPAPKIALPTPVLATMALPKDPAKQTGLRRRLEQAAGLIMAFLLIMPALAAARAIGLAPGPERDSGLDATQQLVLAGTIEAMSTELAGSRADLVRAEQVQTAVAATLMAGYGEPTQPGAIGQTPTPDDSQFDPTLPALQLTPLALATGLAFPTPTPSQLPSAAPTAAVTATAVPSFTPGSSPTPTSVLGPTPTSMPPPTSTPDVCPALSLGSLTVAGKSADWQIENGSPVELALNELTLDWPSENSQLKKVRLDGALIWNQGDNLPATDIQAGDWKGSPRVPAFADPVLRFEFAADAAVSGYDLLLELNLGCTLAGAD